MNLKTNEYKISSFTGSVIKYQEDGGLYQYKSTEIVSTTKEAYALLNVLVEFIKLKEGVNDECSTKE